MSAINLPNLHSVTGLPYGVISANTVSLWYVAEDTNDYADCECPDGCCECPSVWTIDHDGVKAEFCESLNAWYITDSPVLAPCRVCSPCCPNAGDLDSPDAESTRYAYCLPEDMFDSVEPCPYQGMTKKVEDVLNLK